MANPFADWMDKGSSSSSSSTASAAPRRNNNNNNNNNNNRKRNNHGGGGGGGKHKGKGGPAAAAPAAPAAAAPFNPMDWEQDFWQTDPRSGFNAFNKAAGFNVGQGDSLDDFIGRHYDTLFGNYNAQRAHGLSQNLQFGNYLNALPTGLPAPNPAVGGHGTHIPVQTNPLNPGAWKNYLVDQYKNASLEKKGLAYAPYEGVSRWLAFG